MDWLRKKISGLLAKWGHILKTDIAYLARGSFWLTIGQGASTLTSLALTIAFANLLSKEVYGTYKFIISVAGLLSVFSVSGLGDGILKASATGHDATIFPATREKIRVAFIGTLVGCVVALYYLWVGNGQLALYILITALFLPVFDTFTLFVQYLQGKENFRLSSWYNIVIQISSTIVICLALFLIPNNLLAILIAYFGSYSLFRFIFFRITTAKISRATATDRASIIYGRHSSVINVLGMIVSRLDSIVVFSLLGPVDLAMYSIGISGPTQLKGPMGNLDLIVAARFARRDVASISANMNRKLFGMLLFNILLTVAYIALIPYVFGVIFPQYTGAILYSQVFALSLLGGALLPINSFMTAHQKVREQYILEIAYSIARIAGVFLGIIWGGILGLVIARVAVGFLSNILQYVLYLRIIHKLKTAV